MIQFYYFLENYFHVLENYQSGQFIFSNMFSNPRTSAYDTLEIILLNTLFQE